MPRKVSVKAIMIAVALVALLPMAAYAQGAPAQYGVRIPAKLPGCFAPVASNLIGSNENDHTRRGSPTLAYDWSAAVGSPVFSICPGVVRRTSSANEGGYGWNVVVDHSSGYSTLYAHCLPNSFRVKPGQQVTAWTQICSIGRTGSTSWPHVHLNIDVKGVHQPVGNYFDQSLLHYCHFTRCQATNKPGDPIRNVEWQQGSTQPVTVQQQAAPTRWAQLLRILAQYPPQTVSLAIMVVLGLLVLLYWLGGKVERIIIIAGSSGMAGALVVVWLFMPLSQPVQAQQQAAPLGGSAWKAAYAFMRKWEGNRCVHDPVRTLKGITQHTYNAWRASQGLGRADVCTSLTEQQAEAIYYNRYWLASGADKLPPAMALIVFDHAVNAGVGEARAIVAQCGNDAKCAIQARLADYRTKSNYALYGRAWVNRVNDLVRYLQKGA